jgi:CRP-like cAMP-binding protein
MTGRSNVENYLYYVKYSKSQPRRINAKARSSVATLMKLKRDKWRDQLLCNLKLNKSILYLILSIGMSLYQEGYHIDCQQSLNAQHSLKSQVRRVKSNGLIHSTLPKP